MKKSTFIALLLVWGAPLTSAAEGLFSISDLSYEGATRISLGTYGDSRIAYTEGTFTVSEARNSIFLVGHSQHQAIAEFNLPKLSGSRQIADLPIAQNKQPFVTFLDRMPTGNPDNINRITGLRYEDQKLLVNGIQYYDGDANNTDTTFIIEDATALSKSEITGFLKLEARAHAAGWMTNVPESRQNQFEGDMIFGFASNYSINSRSSMGPSAFGVSLKRVLDSQPGDTIPTFPLIDYSIDNPIAEDLYNKSGQNDLWTEVSTAYIGFVVPGTDTYAVFGTSGGHNSGIGYKITQDNGHLCGGPCPYEAADVYNYYWFFDVNDMVAVARGERRPYEVRPYEYGEIKVPFQDQSSVPKTIVGASFSPEANRLYLMLNRADTIQNPYESAPIILSYSLGPGSRPKPPSLIQTQ